MTGKKFEAYHNGACFKFFVENRCYHLIFKAFSGTIVGNNINSNLGEVIFKMKAVRNYMFLLGFVASSPAAWATDVHTDREIYRAPSLDGTAGLLTMNIPHTMGAGLTLFGGASSADILPGVYENLTEVVVGLRVGLSDNIEIGLRTKSFTSETIGGNNETGLGDAEAMIKWKFREQNENLPAMALGFGVMLPTGDEDKGFREVDNWGLKFSVMAGAEVPVFEDSYLGLYAELQTFVIDKLMGDRTPYSDLYGVVNFGFAFPISDNNRLSFFTEFNRLISKDVNTVRSNYTAITPGFRFAHKNISLTLAAQRVDFEDVETTQHRALGLLSIGF